MSETKFIKGDKSKNFTVLDNTCLRDVNLSWGAKGFHCFLESLPGDWKLLKADLVNRSTDKRTALNRIIDELVAAGYIEIESHRLSNGRFDSNCYYVYEKPVRTDQCRLSAAETPNTDNPNTENKPLLNTKRINTDKQKTEQTNLEAEEKTTQTVSESFFVSIIKGLFSGQYPFDKNFESGVQNHLSYAEIDEVNLESYLKYVFDRTKLENVKKSFEGLYRTLALSKSIIRDFKNSNFIKKPEETKKAGGEIKHVDCPICSTRFDKINFSCPTCGLSLREMSEPLGPEFIVKKTLYEMSESERQKYESALSDRAAHIKLKTGRTFLLENEKIHFWKDYGILDE